MTALIVLTKYPDFLKSLFNFQDLNERGFYSVNICFGGMWKVIVLDDYLPSYNDSRGMVFCKSDG